jgi:osmotically-inducible protein OsmY
MKLFFRLLAIGCLVGASAVIADESAVIADKKSAGDRVDDSWIHSRVKAELVGQGATNINIEVYQGIVQLAGFVESEARRETADKVAASVKGVKQVSNKLVVQTSQRTAGRALDDGVVAGKVKAKIAQHEDTSAFKINVEVRQGVVLLSGFVASERERTEAVKIAASINGVIDVINGMDVIA